MYCLVIYSDLTDLLFQHKIFKLYISLQYFPEIIVTFNFYLVLHLFNVLFIFLETVLTPIVSIIVFNYVVEYFSKHYLRIRVKSRLAILNVHEFIVEVVDQVVHNK